MTAFITTWETTAADESITLPLLNAGTYNAVVDWGDAGPTSTITAFDDVNRIHTYTEAGTHTVSITGLMGGWGFSNGGDKLKIKTVEQWGDEQGWESFSGGFYGCTDLVINATDAGNFGSVTLIGMMFREAILANPDVSSWDVSSVTSMSSMFYGASSANPDVSLWDVSSVTNMSDMFYTSSFSTANYDLLLNAWSQLALQPDVIFSAGSAKYRSPDARAVLTDTFNWTITDGGADGANLIDGFLWYGFDDKIYLGDGTLQTSLAASGDVKVSAVYSTTEGKMQLTVDGVDSVEVDYDGALLAGTLSLFLGADRMFGMRNLKRYSGSYDELKEKRTELMA